MTTPHQDLNRFQIPKRWKKRHSGKKKANEERRKKGPKISPNVYYHEANARIKLRLFFALENEGKERFLQQHVHVNLNTVKFKFFHDACELLLKREKNYIIKRMQLYIASHGVRESLESFYLRVAGLATNCGWTEEIEKEVIRDIFIAKMRFSDIQRELCIRPGATVDDTLKSALLQEKGYVTANNLQKQNPSTASNSANFINTSNQFRVKQEPLMSIQSKNNVQNRMNRALRKGIFKPKNQQDQSNTQSKPCYSCGRRFTPEHKAKCQARGATCRNCGKKGHFAKCCNSTQVAILEQPEPGEEEDCNFIESSDSEENYSVLKISETSSQMETVKNLEVINSATGKTKCLRTTLKTRGSLFSATIDTGSPASFVNKHTAETLLANDPNAKIISLDKYPLSTTYVDYNHKPIKLFGILEIDIYSNGWKLNGAKNFNIRQQNQMSISFRHPARTAEVTTQLKPPKNSVNTISEEHDDESAESILCKNKFIEKYNDVFQRLGRSKNHKVFTLFKSLLIPIQFSKRAENCQSISKPKWE